MVAPRVDQINVVVSDVRGAAKFLADLGVEVPPTPAPWDEHHRNVPTSNSLQGHDPTQPTFGIDLDSSAFANYWGAVASSFTGVVINVRVDDRAEVDRVYAHALSIGALSRKPPFDAFWGARYAVVEGPGPLLVGLMSESDASRRAAPPNPPTFA